MKIDFSFGHNTTVKVSTFEGDSYSLMVCSDDDTVYLDGRSGDLLQVRDALCAKFGLPQPTTEEVEDAG